VNPNGSVIGGAAGKHSVHWMSTDAERRRSLPMQQSDQATLFKAVEMKQVRNESDVGRTR